MPQDQQLWPQLAADGLNAGHQLSVRERLVGLKLVGGAAGLEEWLACGSPIRSRLTIGGSSASIGTAWAIIRKRRPSECGSERSLLAPRADFLLADRASYLRTRESLWLALVDKAYVFVRMLSLLLVPQAESMAESIAENSLAAEAMRRCGRRPAVDGTACCQCDRSRVGRSADVCAWLVADPRARFK